MDELLKPAEGTKGAVELVLKVVGGVTGVRVALSVIRHWWGHREQQDKYRHEEHATSEERAWKRVTELEEQLRAQAAAYDTLMREKHTAELNAKLYEVRLEGQMAQNTLICGELAELRDRNDDLEHHATNLLDTIRTLRNQQGIP
jgi:hypothetical protein